MKRIGLNFVDYWQGSCGPQVASRNRFGIRIMDGRIWVVMKLGDEPPFTYGTGYSLPVQFEALPIYVQMIVDDHVLNYPSSDVMDVLAGKQSLWDASGTESKVEPKRVSRDGAIRLPNAS